MQRNPPEKALRHKRISNKIRHLRISKEGSPNHIFFLRALVSFWKKIDFPKGLL
jgi:hypothetical protein